MSQVQLGLFAPQLPEPALLDVTLARMRAIVGDENVGRAVLTDTNQFDGFRMEPFKVSSIDVVEAPVAPLRPAMRRLRPAEAVFVTLQGDRPRTFLFRGRRYSVERAYGPWLTSGEWWSATLWGCEQWDFVARAHEGSMFCGCLMRDVLRDQWQMVAIYD